MTEYLTGARRLPRGFDADAHLARLDEDGFTILENYVSEAQLARFREGLKPYLGMYRGRNPFEGLATERVYTLVGRGKVYEEIASDHRLLAILDGLLAPNYLLSADHAICIYPGEKAQALHFDDAFYPFPRPRPAISISVIGAIDAFTPENGGTVLYRGSHKWSSERIKAVRDAVARGERAPTPNAERSWPCRRATSASSRARSCTAAAPTALTHPGSLSPTNTASPGLGRRKTSSSAYPRKGAGDEPRDADPPGLRTAPARRHYGPGRWLPPDQDPRS
jgi:Phytanoyl-CoA dioxygenase (PhyH)